METVKLSTKGQIVIPKNIRGSHHLSAGSEFLIAFVGDEIRRRPIPAFAASSMAAGKGLLARAARERLSEEAADLAIGELLKAADEASKG